MKGKDTFAQVHHYFSTLFASIDIHVLMKPSHPLSVVFLVTMVSFISSGLAMDDARQSVPEEGQKKELFTSSFDDHKDRMPSYQSTSRRSSPPYDMTTEKILSTSKKGDKLPSIGYSKKSSHTSASIELPRLDQEAFMERSRKSYLGSQRRPTEESKNIEESQKRERVRRIEKSQKIDESPKIQRSRGRNMDGLLNSSSIRTTKSNAPTTTTSRSFQKREDIHSYHGYKNETSSSPKFIGHSPPQFSKKMYNGSSSTESIEEKKTECTPNGTTSTSSSSSHEDTATQRQTKKSYHNDKESYSNFMLFKKKLHRKSNGISRSEGRNPQRSTRHVPDPNELLIDPLRVATAVGSLVLRGFPDLGLIYTGLLAADRAGYLDYGYEVGNKAIEMTVKAGEISLPYIKTVSTNVGSYLAEKSSELASSLYIKCTNYFQPVGDSDEWTVVGAPTNSELAEKAWNNSLKRVLVEELNFMEKFSSSFLSIAEQLQISEDFNIKKLYTFFFQNALSRIQNYIEEKMGPTMGLSYTCRDSVPYLTRSKKLDEIKYYWSADQDADFQDLVFSIPEILFVLLEVRGFYLHYFNVILSLPVVYNVPDDLFLIPLERYTAFCHDLSEHFFNTKGFELFNKIYNGTLTKWRSQFLILDNLHLAIEGTDVFKGSASTAVPFEGLDDSEAGQLYYRFRRHVNMKIVAFNSEENLDEQVKKGRLDSAEYGQYDIAFTFSYLIIMRAESVRVFSHADWYIH